MTEADEDGRLTASRSYSGNSDEPVPWDALEQIFDAMFGSDAQSLRSWPETMNNVSAQWRDEAGVTHKAASLAEVREAYERQDTYDLRFWRVARRWEALLLQLLAGRTASARGGSGAGTPQPR